MQNDCFALAADSADLVALRHLIGRWASELGFDRIGVSGVELGEAEANLFAWLAQGNQGDMGYLERHGTKRSRPAELIPGTLRVICARMNYLPAGVRDTESVLADGELAFVSRYALGRDYHKVLRNRLQELVSRIEREADGYQYRVFTDSAPVMEVELAARAGLGWRGKHTLLLNREAGSWFFLGEIYTDLPLQIDVSQAEHCGTCTRCIDVCPTRAIVAPFKLDACRCISYLTIEHKGSIPEELRPLIGNRVYGCDDCQLYCPWNKFAQPSAIDDFSLRNGLDGATLVELFGWSKEQFLSRLEGSAIRRIGYERWLRNLAVGLGNAPTTTAVIEALNARRNDKSALVREHVAWALARHSAPVTPP